MIKYLLPLLLLSSCGPQTVFYKKDPRLDKYVNSFNTYYNVEYVGSYYIEKDWSDGSKDIGICRRLHSNSHHNVIVIKESYWNTATEASREQLMFHELGHCVLRLSHNDNMWTDGCPSSIMNTVHLSDACYNKYRWYYLEDLKK